jgi:hypothetical protein
MGSAERRSGRWIEITGVEDDRVRRERERLASEQERLRERQADWGFRVSEEGGSPPRPSFI